MHIFLLLAFVSKINFIRNDQKLFNVLRLALPDDDFKKDELFRKFSGKGFLDESKRLHKKFITIYLTGTREEDKKRFELIRFESRKIMYTCDTMNIVKVHFNENCTYGEFVDLVSMMVEDGHKRYMYYQDDFYIPGEPPEMEYLKMKDDAIIRIHPLLL